MGIINGVDASSEIGISITLPPRQRSSRRAWSCVKSRSPIVASQSASDVGGIELSRRNVSGLLISSLSGGRDLCRIEVAPRGAGAAPNPRA